MLNIDAIVDVLRWANGQGMTVQLTLEDGRGIVGVPTSVDLHPTAHEVFLRPEHNDETEIGISLSAITHAELA